MIISGYSTYDESARYTHFTNALKDEGDIALSEANTEVLHIQAEMAAICGGGIFRQGVILQLLGASLLALYLVLVQLFGNQVFVPVPG